MPYHYKNQNNQSIFSPKTATQSTASFCMKKNLYNSTVYRSLAMHNVIYTVHYTVLTDIYIRLVLIP